MKDGEFCSIFHMDVCYVLVKHYYRSKMVYEGQLFFH